jgi:hypothetical protein
VNSIEELLRRQPGAQSRGLLAPSTATDLGATAPDTDPTLTVAPASERPTEQTFQVGSASERPTEQTFQVGSASERPTDLAIPLLDAQRVDPDQRVKDLEYSAVTGWPVAAINADPEIGRGVERNSIEKMLLNRPAIQRLLTNPDIAPLVVDDVGALAAIEDEMKPRDKEFSFWKPISSNIDNFQGAVGSMIEVLGEQTGGEDLKAYGKAQRVYNEQQITARGPTQSITGADTAGEALTGVVEAGLSQIPTQGVIWTGGGLGALLGGGLGLLGGPFAALTVPGGAAIGGFLGSLAASVTLMVGQTQSALKKRDPDLEAPLSVLSIGIAAGLLERATFGALSGKVQKSLGFNPADAIAKRLVGQGKAHVAKRAAAEGGKGMLREGTTELTQDTLVEFGTAFLTGQEVDLDKFGPQALESFVAGAIIGGGMSSTVALVTEPLKIKKAQAYHDNVVAVMDSARESALRTRSPEVFQEYLQSLAADTGREDIAFHAAPLVEYLSEQGLDPAEVLAEFGVDRKTLSEAYELGGDVSVDMATFVAKAADSEHLDAMLLNARESEKMPTMAQTSVLQETLAGVIDTAVADAKKMLDGQEPDTLGENTLAEYVEKITKQIKKTGIYPAKGAEDVGEVFGAWAHQVAQAYAAEGKEFDVVEFMIANNLSVERANFAPEQGAVQQEPVFEDPLLAEGAWTEQLVSGLADDGNFIELPAGVARDILKQRQSTAQALLECVRANS